MQTRKLQFAISIEVILNALKQLLYRPIGRDDKPPH